MKASEVIPCRELSQWTLYGQFPGKELYFDQNCCATRWLDVKELVASQDIDVLEKDGKLCNEDFLEVLEGADKPVSASFRWAVKAALNPQVSSPFKKIII